MIRKLQVFRLSPLLILGSALLLMPLDGLASEVSALREVEGKVLAVNTSDTPQVIVVRSVTAGEKEVIVGAAVNPDIEIKRGNQRVKLENLKVGDTVSLTYVKTLHGLVARSIRAR